MTIFVNILGLETPCINNLSFLDAAIVGFNCRMLPAAKFLGFEYDFSLDSSNLEFIS